MKFLKQGVCLVLLGAGLAAVPGIQASAAGTAGAAGEKSLVQQIRDEAQGSVALTTRSATGKVGFVRAARGGDLMPSVQGDSASAAAAKAHRYVARYAPAFGARASELTQSRITASPYGWTVAFTQSYRGVPVFGAMLKASIDQQGDLTAVSGYAAPGLDLSVTPRVSKTVAASRAVATVRANPPGEAARLQGLRAARTDLVVYRTGVPKGDTGRNVLAWQVEVGNGANIREAVFVDASTGKFLNRYSLVNEVFETDRKLYVEDIDPANLIWEDGDPFPGGLDQEQQDLTLTTGNAYWLFANTFEYDSYDGAGATMLMVNDYLDPDPAYCPNANWNGTAIRICDGTGPDDVVAHEWAHAYTEYTSGLIYQWQSGALNESYSDVWGETIDLINAREDGGEGDLTLTRPAGQCSTHSPPTPLVAINSPAEIAKECVTGGYLGPDPMPTVTGDVVAPTDADEDAEAEGATTLDGCSPYDQDVTGKVVLVNRGFCTFVAKAQMAKDEGATALIIGNRDASPVSFSDADQTLVPTVSIGLEDREDIRAALTGGETVNVTISDASGERVDSYRWLIGEKAESFGGSIRDMWNPTCYGDPGKVSDVEYKCSTDDNGGVHGNSGVPNHAFALAVDGGNYNGVDVAGIGLDKAANIWWQTQTAHLTPTSNFIDMSDGLMASCTELIGAEIKELELTRETPAAVTDPITQEDCDSVADAIAATEMDQEPVACNFQPLLDPNAPKVCGPGMTSKTVWKENFEDGLDGWTKAEELFWPQGHGYHWRAKANAPQHDSKVAYAPDPIEGDCAGGANDISSRNAIISKAIEMGAGTGTARLTFQHYMASEAGWDGGNLKIAKNGGKFKAIPLEAYLFNAPNTTLFTIDEGNSNPMEGEAAWTGTNGGEVFGSWGQTQIRLKKAGISKGDSIKLRFDFGRDGCNGVDGWYVDNVKIVRCVEKANRKAILGTRS